MLAHGCRLGLTAPQPSATDMPIYAYKCESCGHSKDVLQKISDDPLTVCPQCGQARYNKQVTAAGFQLKGSGWYVTDFRGGSSAPAADSDSGAKSDSGASAAPAAESGSAAAAPAASPAPAAAPAAADAAAPAAKAD